MTTLTPTYEGYMRIRFPLDVTPVSIHEPDGPHPMPLMVVLDLWPVVVWSNGTVTAGVDPR